MTTTALWILNGCIFLCIGAIFAAFKVRDWWLDRDKERVPVSEKLLRAPGESLRKKVEELSDKLMELTIAAILFPGWVATAVLFASPDGKVVLGRGPVAAVLGLGLLALLAVRMFRVQDELRNYRLGFLGERAVGEEINLLMRDGCHVFHDVPMEPYGNIDHVIVAPTGVFAVETKTRRKRKGKDGKRNHEVVFDGKALEFPNWRDTASLEQARQQADRLRLMLGQAVGEAVAVAPVLTLPGWMVISRVNLELKVVNPKQIGDVVFSRRGEKLPPELMERIAYQLKQKCRDVEL